MNFHVGQKVVCVDDAERPCQFWQDPASGLDGLTKGDVYTITGMYVHPMDGCVVLVVAEIDRGINPDGSECGYDSSRFRPVAYPKQSEETDVALFTHHLTDQPVDA